jgi:hypothetical protein
MSRFEWDEEKNLANRRKHGISFEEAATGQQAEDDQDSGTIYVLRSKSDHPIVAANRDLVHKIGVTWMSPSASPGRGSSPPF